MVKGIWAALCAVAAVLCVACSAARPNVTEVVPVFVPVTPAKADTSQVLQAPEDAGVQRFDLLGRYAGTSSRKVGFSVDAGIQLATTSTTRQMFITRVDTNSSDSSMAVTVVCWLVSPASQVNPRPTATSSVPSSSIVNWGATTAEVGQIQAGNIVEQVMQSGQFPQSTSQTAIQNGMNNACQASETNLLSNAPPIHLVGMYFDKALADGGGAWNSAP